MRRLLICAGALMVLAGCDAVRVENKSASSDTEESATMARLDYVEIPAADVQSVATASAFYQQAFGWKLTSFGPEYAATTTGDTDMGISAAAGDDAITKPLPVIRVKDLEASLAAVRRAGGTLKRPIFAFPGGRRFHAIDPAGNEFAVYGIDEGESGE